MANRTSRKSLSRLIPSASVANTLTLRTAQNQCKAALGLPTVKVWTPAEIIQSIRTNDRQVSLALHALGKTGLLDDRQALYAYNWMVRKHTELSGIWVERIRLYILASNRAIGYLTNKANGVDAVPTVKESVSGSVRFARPNMSEAERMARAAGFGHIYGNTTSLPSYR